MTRRDKVKLFEQIRREYEFGVGTIAGVARKFGVHRRMVRQAIENAIPPSRKTPQRNCPVLDPVRDFIDQILIDDQKAPRKQRHTAHRIYVRLCADSSALLKAGSTRHAAHPAHLITVGREERSMQKSREIDPGFSING